MLSVTRTRPSTTRLWGAVLGVLPALLLSILRQPNDEIISLGGNLGGGIVLAAGPIGGILGWLFAPVAARSGWRSGITAAAGFAAVAVVIGSFAVAALIAFVPPTDPGAAFGQTLTAGLFGLILLGIPMFVFILPIALLWVAALRVVTRRPSPG